MTSLNDNNTPQTPQEWKLRSVEKSPAVTGVAETQPQTSNNQSSGEKNFFGVRLRSTGKNISEDLPKLSQPASDATTTTPSQSYPPVQSMLPDPQPLPQTSIGVASQIEENRLKRTQSSKLNEKGKNQLNSMFFTFCSSLASV